MDPLDRSNVGKDGRPIDRKFTHLSVQFDAVLGRRGHATTGLPEAYNMNSHWEDVDTFEGRQPMRENLGDKGGVADAAVMWGQKGRTERTRPIEAADVLPKLAQRYGMGYMHALPGRHLN